MADTIQCRLQAESFDVITASDGQGGLEKAADEKPDFVLLDTRYASYERHEMLEQLRKHQDIKDIPVIVCAALCEVQGIAATSICDITEYVTKPFDSTGLIEKKYSEK